MAAIAALSSCSSREDAARSVLAASQSPDQKAISLAEAVEAASQPYPRAPWRLSETPRSSMVVAASHIVISFKGAKVGDGWSLFVPKASERTIEDAAHIALTMTRQLFDAPERFEEFAKKWSDDATTAQTGGRLGVFRGDQVPEGVLDALAVIAPTMVAQYVVRTPFGFHIFRRDALPAAERVSLVRILIGFQGSPESWELRRRPSRTLAEARSLADSLAHQVASDPAKLVALVREHSDGVEALRDGDLGELEPYARIPYPLRRSARELGEKALPLVVETALGFEVVVRTHPAERRRYAASQILIGDTNTPRALLCRDAKRTRQEAALVAARAATLASGKDDFESVSKQYCDGCSCAGFEWQAGQADPRIENALAAARPGQVVGPVETPIGHVVLRCERPSSAPAKAVDAPRGTEALYLGIPKPPITRVEHYVTLVEGKALAHQARRTAQHLLATTEGQFGPKDHAAIAKAYEQLASAWESPLGGSPEGRHQALQAWRKQMVASIGSEKAQALMRLASEWVMRSAGLGK